jgi:hypothetical protein
MLKWLSAYKGGAWRRAAEAADWWRVLALAIQTQRRQGSRKALPLESVVSYWIALVDEGPGPSNEDHVAARQAWEQLEAEGAPELPPDLAAALACIGQTVDTPARASVFKRVNEAKRVYAALGGREAVRT